MENQFTLEEGGRSIRFTPDGKVAVTDAVEALTGTDDWAVLWDKTISENPDILQYCDRYSFGNEADLLVADSEGWGKIAWLLFESMADENHKTTPVSDLRPQKKKRHRQSE